MRWLERQAKRLFFKAAETMTHGSIEIVCPDRTYVFTGPGAGPAAMMVIHDERTFWQAISRGDRGLGESYVGGDWSSPDLVALLRLALRNKSAFGRVNGPASWLSRQTTRIGRWARRNTKSRTRRDIAAHYDIGNRFFASFLDDDLVYSSGWFEHATDSLERAQQQKLERICRKMQLGPDDHVLEIGTGWGAFAAYAAGTCGCRVTTTTISREQHDFARARFERLGNIGDRITLLNNDYRDVDGRFDKVVSIEMFEAVGLAHYDEFFAVCERVTGSQGSVLLQTITINEQDFRTSYSRAEDWIQAHVFPGSELACLSEVLRSIGRVTTLRPFHLEDMGTHYARTLACWRARFHAARASLTSLGSSEPFLRLWDLYLAFSEAGFAERHISDVQLVLTRAGHDKMYLGEPFGVPVPVPAVVRS